MSKTNTNLVKDKSAYKDNKEKYKTWKENSGKPKGKIEKKSYKAHRKLSRKTLKANKFDLKVSKMNLRKEKRALRSERVGQAVSIFGIITAILLIVAVFRMLNGSSIPTFESFLDMLINLETVDIGFINNSVIVLEDWGFWNFIRNFLAFFIDIFNVIIFVFNGLINLVIYAYSILRWIFV